MDILVCIYVHFKLIFFSVTEGERERLRDFDLLTDNKYVAIRTGIGPSRSQKVHPGLSLRCQAPKNLTYHLLFSGARWEVE